MRIGCLCYLRYSPSNRLPIADWKVAGGVVNGSDSFSTFETILDQASSQLDTGFIVLQHDLFEVTVDLAVGYTLNAALQHSPKFDVRIIIQLSNTCSVLLNFTFPAVEIYR